MLITANPRSRRNKKCTRNKTEIISEGKKRLNLKRLKISFSKLLMLYALGPCVFHLRGAYI